MSSKTMTQTATYNGKYALTGLVECGGCGSKYKRTTWARNGKKRIVWRCVSRLDYGKKYCEKSPTIAEEKLHTGIMSVINSMLEEKEALRTILYGTIAEIMNAPNSDKEIITISDQIDKINKEIINMITKGVEERKDRTEIEEECKNKYKEVSELQEHLNAVKAKQQLENAKTGAVKEIFEMIDDMPMRYGEYSDSAVRKMVTKVKILSEQEIEVTLMNTVALRTAI